MQQHDSRARGARIDPAGPTGSASRSQVLGSQPASVLRTLLYVSNSNDLVNIYRYWQKNLVGVLTNFNQPVGMCLDDKRNVYMTDRSAETIVEYSHGASTAIRTINDAPFTLHMDAPSIRRPATWPSPKYTYRFTKAWDGVLDARATLLLGSVVMEHAASSTNAIPTPTIVRPARIELATLGLGVPCSIQFELRAHMVMLIRAACRICHPPVPSRRF